MFPKRPDPVKPIPPNEQGYVLIAAIWLLVLGGSIVAVIMLRTMTASRAVVADSVQIADKLARDGAIDTVVADIIFNGNRSRWAQLPATGSVDIGGRQVNVAVSSETGLLDVNVADPPLIDGALRGFGIAAGPREALIDQLLLRRATKQPLRSRDELVRVLVIAGVQTASDICLVDVLTVSSGLSMPQVNQMPAALARAMGVPRGGGGAAPNVLGEPLRIVVRSGSGAALGVTVRPVENRDQSIPVLDHFAAMACNH